MEADARLGMGCRLAALAGPVTRVHLTIRGEIASKSNSREIVHLPNHRPILALSRKAKGWLRAAEKQVPVRDPLLTGPLIAYVRAFYASERPDLDVELLFDVLQGRVYANDRQVREKHAYHRIDRSDPRVEVVIEPMQGHLV